MKFAEVDIADLITALRAERGEWIEVADREGRRLTDGERTTISILAALSELCLAFPSNPRSSELLPDHLRGTNLSSMSTRRAARVT
jgi:hypothetical protein